MRRAPLLIVLAAWALPGLGHLLLGRRAKAAWFGLLILGTFGIGLWLGEGASVSSARYPWHMVGQIGAGLVALLADGVLGGALDALPDGAAAGATGGFFRVPRVIGG